VISIYQIPLLQDNYAYILLNKNDRACVVIDPGEADLIQKFIVDKKLCLSQIWLTHHHADHVAGVAQLKRFKDVVIFRSTLRVGESSSEVYRVKNNDSWNFGHYKVYAIATPGHTLDHICYYVPRLSALFSGDTLFSLGCGCLFEGNARQMWESLCTIRSLPDTTKIYCAHEYTVNNAKFALSVDPHNLELRKYMQEGQKLRTSGESTIPVLLKDEKKMNPFLRADQRIFSQRYGETLEAFEVFACLRKEKDEFVT